MTSETLLAANDKYITKEILAYMRDSSARYAIALEGEWGSGKTRYCTTILREALKSAGKTAGEFTGMIHISLFGMRNSSELLGALGMAMLQSSLPKGYSKGNGGTTTRSELQEFINSSLINMFNSISGKQGFSLSLTPLLLYHLLASSLDNKKLIVIDDVERNQFSDEKDFFGIINNLVENQNCKVLFVTNDFQMLNSEIREKLIWKCLTYAPDSKELATALLCGEHGVKCGLIGIDYVKCIRTAAEYANCHNARAIIKAKPLIQMALSSGSSIDSDYDSSCVEETLTGFIEYSLLEASGNPPMAPDYITDKSGGAFDAKYLVRVRRYREYASLHVIHDFFTSKHPVDTIDVHEALSSFLSWKYPETMDSMRVKWLFDQYDRVDFMNDLEASLYARLLYSSYFNIPVETSYILEYVRKLFSLLECGFFFDNKSVNADKCISAFSDKVYERSCELVSHNIVKALKMLQEEPDNHFPNDSTVYSKDHFEKLKEFVENEYRTSFQREVESIADGLELHVFINEEIDNKRNPLQWLSPSWIADLFCNGDGQSQIEVINGISKIRCFDSLEFSEWADELADELDKRTSDLDFNNPLFRHRCSTLKSILKP